MSASAVRRQSPELTGAISAAMVELYAPEGADGVVTDGRVALQTDIEDEFTDAIERMTHRRVVAFMSANQTTPGVACELFLLDAAPLAARARSEA
jgi:hypothetical protein